jgi:adenine-specific DNA-methyltransferase
MNDIQIGQVARARRALALLNFDTERTNERSALVLLALLHLGPNRDWVHAANPRLRTVEIMEWLRHEYDSSYKPNTRETIRRQTLHQFVDAGMVALNPDDPARPVNSPKSCYQVVPRALELLRSYEYESHHWDELLSDYLTDLPGLREQYERTRIFRQIPVTLPDGSEVTLTPGGQNILIKQMLEGFCTRFTPGGHVLYVGDAGKDDPVYCEDELRSLGVTLDKHGKFPDLIVHLPHREWLVLMEAASSHGPVDGKRYRELRNLFASGRPRCVFVSCFPSRAEMRKYLSVIAWETEVWCADEPSHLIHFNGERFLGPYEAT